MSGGHTKNENKKPHKALCHLYWILKKYYTWYMVIIVILEMAF